MDKWQHTEFSSLLFLTISRSHRSAELASVLLLVGTRKASLAVAEICVYTSAAKWMWNCCHHGATYWRSKKIPLHDVNIP
jgi:hypothetical protein